MEARNEKDQAASVETTQPEVPVRQRLSSIGKVAFWTLLVGTILSGALVLVLAIFNGSPSQDSVISAVCWLVCTLLIVSGVRWLQAVSIPVGAYLIYVTFTEPFVIESLANPKGPNGGFGHFQGDVVICALLLVAFAASVGTVLQAFRPQESKKLPRWFRSSVNVVVGMAIGALFIGGLAQPAAPAGLTYTNGEPTIHMSAGNFLQPSVTIAKGSKLLLVDDSSAVHILANGSWQNGHAVAEREAGAPLVNNVQVSGNSAEIGPFTVAGTYHIYCMVHPGMNLTIVVQ